MSPSSLACPHCSSPLRVKNRALVGKQIPCPDCNKLILVVSTGPRELALRKPKSDTTRQGPVRANQIALPESNRFQNWITLLKSPVGISWLVAGLFALMMLIAAWPSDKPPKKLASDSRRKAIANKPSTVPNSDERQEKKEIPDPAPKLKLKQSEPDRPPAVAEKPVPPPVVAEHPRPPQPFPDRPPVVAEIPPVRIDIAGAFKQPIQKFHTQQPLPLRELLMLVDEMVPVPIHYKTAEQELGSEPFDRPISLKLDNTSVGEILKAILTEANLDYTIGFNEIHLVKAGQEKM